jgi:uncharacterized membrane protein
MKKHLPTLLTAIVFYAGWWGLVSLVSKGHHEYAPLIALSCAGINLYLDQHRRGEFRWLVVGTLLGFLLDSFLQACGVISFAHSIGRLAPLWITSLWLLFVSSFESFNSLKNKLWVCAILGAVGGPLSYSAGILFKVLNYGDPESLMITLHVVCWAILFPLMIRLREKVKSPLPTAPL